MAMKEKKKKKKKQVHSLLQSKAPSDITRLLLIDAAALKAHCGAHSPGSSDVLRLAVDARAQTRGWTILACPRCHVTFFYSQALSDHVVSHHLRPNEELKPLMPKKADRNRVDALLCNNNWDWESTDGNQENRNLLEAIRSALQKLAEKDVLADSQLDILFKIAGGGGGGDHADDRSPTLCFRSSKAPKLRMVVTLLEGLISECCGNVETESSSCGNGGEEIEAEEILVNEDGSKLVLNAKQFLKQSCVPDADALVSWLYDDGDENDLSDWNELKKDKKNRGNEIYEKLKEEFEELEMICMKKHSCLRYRSAVVTLEKVFVDLVARTEQSPEAVMRKIRGDLSERTGNDTDVLRHVAANVCKEAESLRASKMRNLVKLAKQEDNSTVEAFQKQLWDSDFEETKCDARLSRKSLDIGRLEAKLDRASALDYLAVVVPLVKSFLRRLLEDEARHGVATAKNRRKDMGKVPV